MDEDTCPACGAGTVLPIVYGMPMPDDVERLKGQVVFAGCCIPDPAHAFMCTTCRHSWGSIFRGEPEPSGSPFDELDEG